MGGELPSLPALFSCDWCFILMPNPEGGMVNAEYGIRNLIPEVSRVVDTITGRTELVHKVLPTFGVQVWVKERSMERENWPWSWLTLRQPRLIKRYPRPFRFPREVPTPQCHCKIGRMEVEDAEERRVRCTRCKQLVGSEAFPRRIERAEEFIRKACARIERECKVQKGVQRRTGKTSRHSKSSRKGGKRSKNKLGFQPARRSNAKTGTSKNRRKRAEKIPKGSRQAVSKTSRAKISPSSQRGKESLK